MANSVINNISYFVQGDGGSLTALIDLGFVPASATLVGTFITSSGAVVTSNVYSFNVNGQIATIAFFAPFSYILTVVLNILPTAIGRPVNIASLPVVTIGDLSGSNISPQELATQRRQLAELTMIRKGIEILIGRLLVPEFETNNSNNPLVG